MTFVRIQRHSKQTAVTVGTSVDSSTTMSASGRANGVVFIGGVTASATLTIHGSMDGVTFVPLSDSSGAAATLVVPATGGAVAMPDSVFGLQAMKMTTDSALGTAATVSVVMKS